MTDNDRFEDMLRDAARTYNAPPDTPREAMWEAVRHGLEEQGGTRAGVGDALRLERDNEQVRPLRRPQRDWMRWAAGIAAALVVGFGLGRWQGADNGGTSAGIQGGLAAKPGSSTSGETRASGTMSDTIAARSSVVPSDPAAMRERSTSSAYRVAAIQHLTQMEMLLTSFRAEAQGGRVVDDQLSVWAADLLGTTRLLLDSPAGDDQRLKRLLEDLELVLAQIAQLV
ncbi:MAG: hypothetical protein ACR2G6_08075 [Gemmatimonadaceae bacterium]